MDLLSQHEAFLRAIFDAPEDDTPRLVYADFLQENGEEERADLIRVQCEFALKRGQTEHSDRLWELKGREWELINQLDPDRRYWELHEQEVIDYERGFRSIGIYMLSASAFANPLAERQSTARRFPERFSARQLGIEPGLLLSPEHIETLFSLPAVQRIPEWYLDGRVQEMLSRVDGGAFSLVEMNQQLTITTRGIEALAQHRGARRITALDLRNNNLDNDAARALVKSPYLDNLKRLQLLEGNRLRGRVWQQVIERFGEDVAG